jgi:hypothetical protein
MALIAMVQVAVFLGASSTVEGFKFMSKFKRGPRIDAAAEAKKEQMFGDKSKWLGVRGKLFIVAPGGWLQAALVSQPSRSSR